MSDEKALIKVHPDGEPETGEVRPPETALSLDTFAGFERMPSLDPRIVEFRIERRGILELRIGRLAAKSIEPGHGLRIQATGKIGAGGQSLNAVEAFQARPTQIGRRLPGKHMRETEAGFKQ